jgi:hypothetical protein
MKAALAAVLLCAPLSSNALAGDGWRIGWGSPRFGIEFFHRDRAPVVIREPIIVRPVVCAPPVPVRVERCEPTYTTLTQNVRIDGRDVPASLVLWREGNEVRSKVVLGGDACEMPFVRDVSFTIEQSRRSWTTEMDPVRAHDRDHRVEFRADAGLCADAGRGFDAVVRIRTRHGWEAVRWCDVRVG